MEDKNVKHSLKIKNETNFLIKDDKCITSVSSVEEVQTMFRQAGQDNTAVYVYREAKPQGISLDLSSMNNILEIDCDNLIAVVEPGVILADLADALGEKGLRFIPADTVYYRHQTVGEWAYSGCPNILAWKYGAGKFFLMGADFVLPTGELLKTGGKTVKNVTGYDLTRFLTGAYADMGVGVGFLLKLLPLPKSRVKFSALFNGASEVLSFVDKLRQQPGVPAYVLWADDIVCGLRFNNLPNGSHCLVCEFEGVQEEVSGIAAEVQTYFKQCGARNVKEYSSEDEDEPFDGLFKAEPGFILTDEYKIPYNRQAEFIANAYKIFDNHQIVGGLFGQLGEGKIHLLFPIFGPGEKAAITELRLLAVQVGGVSSGKYQRLYTDNKLGRLEQSVKDSFDPKHLLNRSEEIIL